MKRKNAAKKAKKEAAKQAEMDAGTFKEEKPDFSKMSLQE